LSTFFQELEKITPGGNPVTPQQNTEEKESTKEKEEIAQEPPLIHRSAWNTNSANFARTQF
jgi:hypothetical protein